jgi:hypothetical protein
LYRFGLLLSHQIFQRRVDRTQRCCSRIIQPGAVRWLFLSMALAPPRYRSKLFLALYVDKVVIPLPPELSLFGTKRGRFGKIAHQKILSQCASLFLRKEKVNLCNSFT